MTITTSAPPVTSLPVSTAQLALWAEEQVDPTVSSTGYFAVTLSADSGAGLTGERLRAAARAVLHRHPPLRSVLRHEAGALRQVVYAAGDALHFSTTDAACAPGEERATARRWTARHESRRRWDLSVEPPIRFHDLRHGPGRRTIVFAVHHAGFDGRSKFLVARDFTGYLSRLVTGRPLDAVEPLPHVMPPEADHALTEEAVRYWAGELSAEREPMALPSGRTPDRHGIVTTRTAELDVAHVTALRDLAARHEVSTFTCLVAAFARQLAWYGNPAPILAVASDVSDETTRAVAGVQVNVVPMLVRADASATPAAAVGEARAALDRMRRYRRVPFQTLLRDLPDDSAARLMTQCGISFPRPPAGLRLEVPGVIAHWDFFTPNTSSTFERTLHLRADWPACRIRLDYRAETLDAAGADSMLDHFTAAVASLATADVVRHRPAPAAVAAPDVARGGGADAVVAARSHAGPDGDVVVLGPVADAILEIERRAARRRDARLRLVDGPGAVPETARRLVGAADGVRAAARARPGRALDLVVPGDQLPAVAHLADATTSVSAYLQWDGRVTGLLTPAPDPRDPPELLVLGWHPATVRDGSGTPVPAQVPGTLVVTAPGGLSRSTPDRALVTPAGTLRHLGAGRERLLRHRGFVDVAVIERMLHTCPRVLDAAVVLLPTRRGNAVAAVVTGHPGEPPPTASEVRAFLHDRLAGFDLPGRIEVRAAMPRDRYGAVDRAALTGRSG